MIHCRSRFDLLLVLLLAALASCSKSTNQYIREGDEFMAQGKTADAVLRYQNAVKNSPADPGAILKLGKALARAGRAQEAIIALARATELNQGDLEAKVILADLQIGRLAEQANPPQALYDQTAANLAKLEKAAPDSFDALRLRGGLAMVNRKFDEAIASLEKAQQLKPFQRNAVLSLAQAYSGAGRAADAEKLCKEMIAKDKEFGPVYDLLYSMYIVQKRDADAEAAYRQKVDNNPKEAAFYAQLAGFYAASGKLPETAQTLQRMFDKPAEFPDARLRAGELYLQVNQPEEALRQFEAGITSDAPRKAEYQKRIVSIWWRQGKRSEAAQLAREIAAANPKDLEARRLRASLLLDAGDPKDLDSVIADYSDIVKQFPDGHIALYQLGQAYRLKGDAENAIKQLTAATKANPVYLAPKLSLAEIAAGQSRFADALRYCDEILTIDRTNQRVRLARSASLRNINRLKEARAEINKLRSELPQDFDVAVEAALIELAEGRAAASEAIFRKLYTPGSKDTRAARGLMDALIAQKKFPEALRLMGEEVKRTPEDEGARVAYAVLARDTGNLPLAMEQYRESIRINPNNAQSIVGLAQIQQATGESAAALEGFRKAASMAPKDAGVQFACATGFQMSGNRAEALRLYGAARALDAQNPLILNNLAYLHAEEGTNLDEALRLAQEAVKRGPTVPNYADTLGFIYHKKGMHDSALQVYRNLVEKNPNVAEFRIHIAQVLLAKGDRAAARKHLDAALSARPNKQEESEIRALLGKAG